MMAGLLAPGDKVRTVSSGEICEVDDLLGAGGQGEVYRCRLERPTAPGTDLALKWYYPHTATAEQRAALLALITSGAPDTRFLWPSELVTADGKPGFGYLMPLREPRYRGITDLLVRRVTPTFTSLAAAGVHLADGFLHLHGEGLCYRDISQGNVFFDPHTGDIRICDNDNVGIDSEPGGVIGTPRFMAPEVVRGEKLPSTQTDLFSLAVLLFLMLMNHHPLDGRKEAEIHCFDLRAMTRLYGHEPVFIFDPADQSNRPLPGYHDNALAYWPIYPEFLQRKFTQSFTDGIRQPGDRVRETEWRATMGRLRDAVLYCACGAENFYDSEALQAAGGAAAPCWHCHEPVPLPPRIRIGRSVVMLNHDSKLYRHHLDEKAAFDYSVPVAEMTRHPSDPSRWGLRNLSEHRWTATVAGGSVRDVDPGRSVTVAAGTVIYFGPSDGHIRV